MEEVEEEEEGGRMLRYCLQPSELMGRSDFFFFNYIIYKKYTLNKRLCYGGIMNVMIVTLL